MMNERFLYYLWKFRLLNNPLQTTDDEPVTIFDPGNLNMDAGPDFMDARIRIDDTLWAGNVEIHVRSSDWKKHGHQFDYRYQNIILHVVYEDDMTIMTEDGRKIPTMVLKNKFDEDLYGLYRKYMERKSWVPCEKLYPGLNQALILPWIEKMALARLDKKASGIERALILQCLDWEQTFYQHLAINFGFKLNGHAFELLAKSLPLEIISKHRHNLFELEALLFGQAGFLNSRQRDDYHHRLRNEYQIFRKRYALNTIDVHLWNFLRLRPPNFPTIRIAQFAYLLSQTDSFIDQFLRPRKLKSLYDHLITGTSVYWETHYLFDRPSPKSIKRLGRESIELILINTVVPFNYVYGQVNDQASFTDKALKFLKLLQAEKNQVTNNWKELGAIIPSAYESQAYLHLKKNYCDYKKCLDCSIGDHVLKQIDI